MAHLIDKDALVAEIEKFIERAKAERVLHPKTILAAKNYLLIEDYNKLLSIIDTLEVKEPASEDLEQAAEEAEQREGNLINGRFKAGFKSGAQWQKEQMMKGAVDGEVNIWCSHISLPKVLPSEFSKQRVKVIIIKE